MKRIALAVITNWLNSVSPYLDFLRNGSKYGHHISQLIIGYSHGYKRSILEFLSRYTKVILLKLPDDQNFIFRLLKLGLTEEEINTLFYFKLFKKYNLIPYGIRRNSVLMQAVMQKPVPDYLFFIDTDVFPCILTAPAGEKKEIDFFGSHLKYLQQQKEVVVTTSDYSGYYIIPPMSFKGLNKLLWGLQKEAAHIYLKDAESNILIGRIKEKKVRETNKVLGGNHGIDLSFFAELPPYFSTYYFLDKKMFLGRGEDTLLGRELLNKGKIVLDVDTRIFHNTYGDFPQVPDIKRDHVRLRFYYACLGWLGRNPFLNWYLARNEEKLEEDYNLRKKALVEGSKRISDYLGNSEFAILPAAFEAAYSQLGDMKRFYYNTLRAWRSFKKKLMERGEAIESTAG